jgi:hypothetical protein
MHVKAGWFSKPLFYSFLIIGIGILLRTLQYIGGSSMWLDELASAKNIESRNYYDLATQSLDFNQVAPIGFLLSQKLMISIFGTSDSVHRFLPWVVSILAIIIFWKISKHFLQGLYLISSLLLFSSSVSLIWLGSNVKHYSGDVAATLFLVWAGISFSGDKRQSWYWAVGILGALSCLISFPAAVMAFGILALVFFQHKRESRKPSTYLIVAVLWLLGAGLSLIYGKMAVAEREVFSVMHEYWKQGFPPSLNPLELFPWIINSTTGLISIFLFYIAPKPVIALSLIIFLFSLTGIVYGVIRMRFKTIFLLVPYLVAIGLAVLDYYPFGHRVAIYSIWPFLILIPLGFLAISNWLKKKFVKKTTQSLACTLALAVFLLVLIAGNPPFIIQPSEPVLKEVRSAMKPDDIIYVYCKGSYAMERYGPRVGIINWISGQYYPEASGYQKDIQQLIGKPRVWFFYTQWTEQEPFPDSIRVYLQTIGKQLKVISKPEGGEGQDLAAAYLYDLSITSK